MSITAQDETARSRPHRRIEHILDQMGISYESEYTEFSPYAIDIYIPEWHIGIEIDGPAHRRQHDEARDSVLREKYFLPVLRIKTSKDRHGRLASAGATKQDIADFIIAWAVTAQERKWQRNSA